MDRHTQLFHIPAEIDQFVADCENSVLQTHDEETERRTVKVLAEMHGAKVEVEAALNEL